MKKIRRFILCLLITVPVFAAAAGPLDVVKAAVDRVVEILNNPTYPAADKKKAQHEAMWHVVQGIFDFQELSRRALGRSWRLFSEQQQQEFVDVFSRFIANIYIDRIQKEYRNQKIEYLGQEMLGSDKALVETKIQLANGTEVPVNNSMLLTDQGWKVYDISIEGVSLVQNYRSQFNDLLLKEKPAKLIEQLKKKVEG